MKLKSCFISHQFDGQTVIVPGMINQLSRLVPKKPAMYFVGKLKKKKDG